MLHMKHHSVGKNEKGYMLIYAVLVVSAMLLFTSVVFRGTLSEFDIAYNARESAKAFSVAESGVECAQYWHNKKNRPFDTNSASSTIHCDSSTSNTTLTVGGFRDRDLDCTSYTWPTFTFGPLSDNSCAEVTVSVEAVERIHENSYCNVRVVSHGYNDCTDRDVERIVWRSM